jgi:hypothetical protein
MSRLPPLFPLTATERAITDHLATENASLAQLAHRQGCSRSTMKNHIERIALKIPGDLPAKLRVTCWARGAALDHLFVPPPMPSTPSGTPLPGPILRRVASTAAFPLPTSTP